MLNLLHIDRIVMQIKVSNDNFAFILDKKILNLY